MSSTAKIHITKTEADPRWAAVVARDASADGTFFFSVKTTGVYCRPGCAARLPRPENIEFYATGEEAAGKLRDRRVLHISSGAARKPYAGWSVYCATKAALDHHARAVQEDATPGLRICALAPGVVDTPMQGEIRASSLERFPLRDRFAELQASGGLIAPAECAMHLVDFLLDEDFGREPVADLRELMQ